MMQELTRQELKAIIGLEIPADLAFLYNMSSGESLLLSRHAMPMLVYCHRFHPLQCDRDFYLYDGCTTYYKILIGNECMVPCLQSVSNVMS